jgi:DNA-binding transcriptional MerR regulator
MLRTLQAPERSVAIGEVRRRTQMTNRAIRFYEDKALISSGRDGHGRRLYSPQTVERLVYIGLARQAGLSISEIRDLLRLGDENGEQARASRTQDLYRGRLADLQAQWAGVEQSAHALGLSLQPQRPQLVAL